MYCFDSFNEAEDEDWVRALLVQRQVSWLNRCIIATRPECKATLVPKNATAADKLNGIAPMAVSMTGFQTKSAQNLMIDLALGADNVELAARVRELFKLHPRFDAFASNPLLCQLVCASLRRQQDRHDPAKHGGCLGRCTN